MKKLKDLITGSKTGLHYGNRILLPFRVEVLKIVIEREILMDFRENSKDASYYLKNDHTEIFLHQIPDIQSISSDYEIIKLVVVKENDSIFDFENHIRISIKPEDKHKLVIDDLAENILFIE